MKKKLCFLFMLMLMVILFTVSQFALWAEEPESNLYITESADITADFTDPIFLDYVRSITNKPSEPILASDVAEIRELRNNMILNIKSLNGIEHFTALEKLDVTYAQLTELDLSKNTALITLHCYGNQLTSLNVSNSPNLTDLNCNDNQLTSLNVSNSPNLSSLYCNSNQLTELNISGNPELTELVCYQNLLTYLDVSNNPKLRKLSCHSNLMKSPQKSLIGWPYMEENYDFVFYPQQVSAYLSNYENPKDVIVTEGLIDVSIMVAPTVTSTDIPYEIEIEYQWYSNTTRSSSRGTLLVGETSATFVVPTDLAPGLYYYYCVMSADYAPPLSSLASMVTVVYAEPSGAVDITDSFTDPNFLKIVRSMIGVPDGPIYDTYVAGITQLDLRQRMISSLNGIEHFTQLTILYCNNNQITTLDVSKNTELELLECLNNQITTLDVSKNTELKYLRCHNNQITTLDVSKNTELEILECYDNQITTLDVSKNTELRYLRCENNKITTLDVSKNTKLTTLTARNNLLTDLNASNNPVLRFLYCENNLITTLNVTGSSSIEQLYCENNRLTTLDISALTKLGRLSCDNNQLTSLDVSNSGLSYLTCQRNQMESHEDVIGWNKKFPHPQYYILNGLFRFTFYPQMNETYVAIHTQPEPVNYYYKAHDGYPWLNVEILNSQDINPTFQWYINTTASNTGGTPINYGTEKILYLTNFDVGTYYYYCVISAEGVNPVVSNITVVTVLNNYHLYLQNTIIWLHENLFSRYGLDKSQILYWLIEAESNGLTGVDLIHAFFSHPDCALLINNVSEVHFINLAYGGVLRRLPEAAALLYWQDALQRGYSRNDLLNFLIASDEFRDVCASYSIPVGITPGTEGFVIRMYQCVLGREHDPEGLDFWVTGLSNKVETGASIANHFFFSDEFIEKNVSDADFVEIAYNTLLNRKSETEGFAYWMSVLENGTSRQEVVHYMLGSLEFRGICERFEIDAGV